MKTRNFILLLLVSMLLGGCAVMDKPLISGVALTPAVMALVKIVTAVLMAGGLLCLFTFVIPGLTIIWLSALVYGLLTGFTIGNMIFFVLITLLMLFGNVVDQLLMGAKAKQSGASWTGVILSSLAAFVFSFLAPPFGGFIAALLVLFIFEFIRLRDWKKAGGTTKEMAVGCVSAVAARFGIGLVMIGLWAVWVMQSSKG